MRTRKSLGDGSDLGRIARQQAFLSSVMQEATSTQLLLQPNKLYAFLDAATSSLTTDPEFGVGTMRDLATSVRGIGLDQIDFITVPTEPYAPDVNRVQWRDSAERHLDGHPRGPPVRRPGEGADPHAHPDASPLTVTPDEVAVTVVNASGRLRPGPAGARGAGRAGLRGA